MSEKFKPSLIQSNSNYEKKRLANPNNNLTEDKQARGPTLVFPEDIESAQEYRELTKITIVANQGGKYITKEVPSQTSKLSGSALANLAAVNGTGSGKAAPPTKIREFSHGKDNRIQNIFLPMPPALSSSNTADWAGTPLGVLGNALTSGKIDNLLNKGKAAFTGKGAGTGVVDDLVASSKSIFTEAGTVISREVIDGLSGISGINVGAAISKSRGDIVNPRQEVIFQGINFRKFVFTWRLQPRSEHEVNTIINIIKTLKYHSAPELGENAGRAGFFLYPAQFEIEFLHVEDNNEFTTNIYVPKIAKSVIENVTVNYTSSGIWSSFNSGAPTDIELTISFQETELITKSKVEDGF